MLYLLKNDRKIITFLNIQCIFQIANLFGNSDVILEYAIHGQKTIVIPKKYKFIYIEIKNVGYGNSAYDYRIMPTFVDFSLAIRVSGINNYFGSNAVIDFNVNNMSLTLNTGDASVSIKGIY